MDCAKTQISKAMFVRAVEKNILLTDQDSSWWSEETLDTGQTGGEDRERWNASSLLGWAVSLLTTSLRCLSLLMFQI